MRDPGDTGQTDRSDAHPGAAESKGGGKHSAVSTGSVGAGQDMRGRGRRWGQAGTPHCSLGVWPSEPGLKEEEEAAARRAVERVVPGREPVCVEALSLREAC